MDIYLIGILGMQKIVFLIIAFVIVLSFVILHIFKNRFFEKGSVSEKKLLGAHNVFQLLMYVGAFAYVYFSAPADGVKDTVGMLMVFILPLFLCTFDMIFLSNFLSIKRDPGGNKYSLYVDVLTFFTIIPSLVWVILYF